MTDSDTDFDIGDFIKDESELFIVLGVFAAFSLYLTELQSSELYTGGDLLIPGFIASIILSGIILIQIYRRLKDEFGSWDDLIKAHAELENWELTLFTISVLILMRSVIDIISGEVEPLVTVSITILIFFSIMILLWLLSSFERHFPDKYYDKHEHKLNMGFLFIIAILSLLTLLLIEFGSEFSLNSIPDTLALDWFILAIATVLSTFLLAFSMMFMFGEMFMAAEKYAKRGLKNVKSIVKRL